MDKEKEKEKLEKREKEELLKYYKQLPSIQKYDEEDSTITQVQIDAVVVIKIIKHSRDRFPDEAHGQLLGLDLGSVLDISNCFPFQPEDDKDQKEVDNLQYRFDMLVCLQELNIETNPVGFYTSVPVANLLEEFSQLQDSLKKSVVLYYDPVKTSQGNFTLRAFRLSSKFFRVLKNETFTKECLAKYDLSSSDIFEEIPLVVSNSSLVNAYLFELQESGNLNSNFKELELGTSPYLEKNFEALIENFDLLAKQQSEFEYYKRFVSRQQTAIEKLRRENTARISHGLEPLPDIVLRPEPSRLDYLLISNQIENNCKQIERFAGNNLSKFFLQSSVWKN